MPSLLDPRRRAAWLRTRLDPGWPLATARAVRVGGPLEQAAVADRLAGLLDRHAGLRERYADTPAGPVAVPDPAAAPDVRVVPAGPREWAAELPAEAVEPADPAAVPPVRVRLYRPAGADPVLLLLAHPVAVDPAALPGLLRCLLGGTEGPQWRPFPAPVPATPADAAYWRRRLAGDLGELGLTGRPVPAGGRGPAVPAGPLPAGTGPELLLAAVAVLLRRYTGVADVPVGVQLPGGPVLLRVDLAGDPGLAAVRTAVAAGLAEAVRHAAVPLAELPGAGRAVRVLVAAGALVAPGEDDWGTAVALGGAAGPVELAGRAVRPLPLAERAAPTDLLVSAGPGGIELVADPAVLAPAVLGWLARDLPAVLAAVDRGTGRAGSALAVAAPERRPPAAPVDDTPFPAAELERCVPARFAELARRYPDRPAVLGDTGTLSYAELAAAAGAVAAAVRAVPAPGGGDPGRVALLLEHGPATVAALLGVLGAGRAYVPLDPDFPPDRLAAALADAEVDLLLTTAGYRSLAAELLGRAGAPVPVLDVGQLPAAPPGPCGCGPDSPAYVLYTSGSTGRPKGVVQAHRGILFQARQHVLAHRIGPADRLSVVSSFGFDMSVTDLFTALLTGAAAVPVDVRRHGLGHLAAALADRGVTVYHSTPTLFRYLVGALGTGSLQRVRVVLLGGEELTRRDVQAHRRHFGPGSVLVNGYGATEVSFALQDVGAEPAGELVPVGRPLDGLEVLLLGPDGTPAALSGEIAVRGRAVALGYRNRPAEQAERFTDLGAGVREYRTGDLGRRLPDGRIAYSGRRDRQVKIRGYRVEPGEIEAVLGGLPGVAQAAVVARAEAAGGTTELLAYATGAGLDGAELRRELERRLPHFAVPRAVLVLDALPLTPTGKLDARALPAPPAGTGGAAGTGGDPVRELVAAAWCAALGVPAVGPDDNFFEVGGHSLLLARVQQQLERELGRPVPLHRLFEHPTVAATARWLTAGDPDGAGAAAGDRVRQRMSRRRDARSRRDAPTRAAGPAAAMPADAVPDGAGPDGAGVLR